MTLKLISNPLPLAARTAFTHLYQKQIFYIYAHCLRWLCVVDQMSKYKKQLTFGPSPLLKKTKGTKRLINFVLTKASGFNMKIKKSTFLYLTPSSIATHTYCSWTLQVIKKNVCEVKLILRTTGATEHCCFKNKEWMKLSPWLYKLVSTAFSEKAFTPSPTRFVEWQCKVTKQSKTTKILTNQWTANLHANTTTVTAHTFHLNSLECCPNSHSILRSSHFRMAFLSQMGVVTGLTFKNMAILTLCGSKLWKDCIMLSLYKERLMTNGSDNNSLKSMKN